MEQSREPDKRTVKGKRMSAALAIRTELGREIPAILQNVQQSAKIIAIRAGVTPRCIEALREHEHGVSAHVLLALAQQYPAVKQLVMRLMDAETGDSGENPASIVEQIRRLVTT